jgi:hypothetical protein
MGVRARMGNHRDAVVVALALAPALALVASIGASPTVEASLILLAPALALWVAVAACWITARHVRGRARLVWRLFALSLGAWALTGLAAAVITALGQEIQTVGPLDVGWFALYPPMIVALGLTYARLRPERGWQGAIDSLALVLALSLPVWLLVIAPALRDSVNPLDAVSVTYPALDLAALGTVGWLVIRYGSRVPGWLAWIAAALACQVLADIVYARFTLVDATTVATASAALYVMAAALWTAAARA